MGLWASGAIFQAQLDKLVGDIEGVETYIDDIIEVGKGFSPNI